MSETAATRPTAIQVLTRTNKVQRTGWCDIHGNRSSLWLGVQPNLLDATTLWAFQCKQPDHARHIFLNHVPKDAPVAAEEVEAWVVRQKEMRAKDLSAGRKP